MEKKYLDLEALERAERLLETSVSSFKIGALTLNDFKLPREKIVDLRKSVKYLKTRIQLIKAKNGLRHVPEVTEADLNHLDRLYKEKVSETLITNQAITICHQSEAVQYLFNDKDADPKQKRKVKGLLEKLYALNDKLITTHESSDPNDPSHSSTLTELLEKQLKLKIECAGMITEYADFLKSQKTTRDEKLKELNPAIAGKKAKLHKLMFKINLMKRLITSFLAAASAELIDHPDFIDYLAKHRELFNDATLQNMVLEESET